MSNIRIDLTTNQYSPELYTSVIEEILKLPNIEHVGDKGDAEIISLTGSGDDLIQAIKICQRKGIVN